jgi:hypothetical protein
MSYQGTSLSTIQEALKEFYLDGFRYQLNDKASPFIAQVEKTSENVEGKEIVMAMRYGRTGGIGNRSDDGDLPTPNARKTKQAKWETKNFFARFRITDKTISASKSSIGAFTNMLEQEISDCETDSKLDLSRQAMGDGNGKIATITTNSVYAEGPPKTLTFEVDWAMHLAEGMLVDLLAVADNTAIANCSSLEVLSVDDSTNTVVLSVGSDVHANVLKDAAFITLAGNYGLELTGIAAVLSTTGTLYGIAKTAYPWLKPQVKDLSSGEISENAMQEEIDLAESRTGSTINYIQCSLGVRRAYIDLLNATKQTVNTTDLKGGFKALAYNGIALVGDRFVPTGEMQFLDMNDWAMYQMGDFDWMDRDGSIMARVPNKPAWEATLVKYCDIGCQRPRGQAVIRNIKEH